ncbi:MAG: CsbD family protein [Aquabacterium sp.]|uniref:CsbD family protein n=1 Tax=Aquabacterium sp. TaxID=1872578 RepID=UPI0025E0E166|nr:CsbD family protein [uncultured Aquabacterium sp.]
MNRDQIKGTAKDVAGKVQREVGKAIGSPEHQGKGLARQAEGKVQKAYGDAKEELNKPRRP